jgi:hypothetical protein
MDEFKLDLSEALRKASAIIRTRIEMQVPVRTGRLRNSVKVYVQDQEVFIEYEDYGVFTNYGTGPYYNGRYGQAQVPGTYQRYQKGVGGIQAQNWTSISLDDDIQIDTIIEEQVTAQTEAFLDNELNNL